MFLFRAKTIFHTFSNNLNKKSFASLFSRMRMKEKVLSKVEKSAEMNKTQQKEANTSLKIKDEKIETSKTNLYGSVVEALREMKKTPQMKENQLVYLVVSLNVDPSKGDQVVRGIFKMPGGSNKIPKLMVFTSPGLHEAAQKAGADFIADTQTYKDVQDGKIEFDKCVCTLDTMPSLKNLGRILGPKGLMPSVKVGTACTADNLEKIIIEIKMGSREFKTDIWGQIQSPMGKYEFPEKNILLNIDSFMKTLQERKPDSIKQRYFLYAYLYTYKQSFRIDMKSLDPKSSHYFMNELKLE